ncbi:MAG TPA: RES family NAD+ phosphorylase [Noviherbaspirillum sp.]|uniref:RES family NAD+ phosphorylase n=1 Tax=Noviherbaspirillum sp. TaxID=1926288 RepID=UPI002F95595C
MAASEAAPTIRLDVWRAVEAQHKAATMLLADSLEEQHLLEQILEDSKPPLPPEARGLHWLLFTPFRYPPLPRGSRFRSPGDPGVFYGADQQRTACAELGYWRWRFLMESELDALDPFQQTLFQARLKGRCIDLRRPPYDSRREQWTDRADYSHCQTFAREAREQGVQVIRYQSVRDPQAGACAAVLSPAAFAQPAPIRSETWILSVARGRVLWQQDSIFPGGAFEFPAASWETS